jgi:hypothetical protein
MTDSASHPNVFVPVIVGLAEPPSMANDRLVVANRTSPRQEVQRDYPGSMLSFASGSAIKIITAGVKAAADRSLAKRRSAGRAFTLRQSQFRTKKEYCFPSVAASPSSRTLAGLKRPHDQVDRFRVTDNPLS